MYETIQQKSARESIERKQQEAEESSRRQGAQIDRLNRESAQREGERQKLQGLLSDEYDLVRQLRVADNPALATRLAEVQQQIIEQAKVVCKFDRAYVEGLGLACD